MSAATNRNDVDAQLIAGSVDVSLTPEGEICVGRHGGSMPTGLGWTLERNVIIAPLCLLDECERTSDGGFVLRGGGHAAIVRDGSRTAIIGGRRVRLEARVEVERSFIDHLRGPLNTLVPLLGSRLAFGRIAQHRDPVGFWVLVWPKTRPIPSPLLTARRVLLTDTSWMLLLDTTYSGESDGGCGRWAGVSGALVAPRLPARGQSPWGEAGDLSRDLAWRVLWSPPQKRGRVSYGAQTIEVSVVGHRLIVGRADRAQKVVPIPPELRGQLASGKLLLPIGPVACALGLRYWQSDSDLRVSGVSPPQPGLTPPRGDCVGDQ